jgi:hypothetical protein
MPLSPDIVSELKGVVGPANVLTAQEDLIPYSFDGTAALQQIPGCVIFPQSTEHVSAILKLVELPEATWCCGSAGIYNLVQPEMAGQLLDRKLKNIRSTGATVVANANSGCLLQLINGARQAGLAVRVVPPMTLMAEAYRRNGA